jgi:copper chaperone CopZ
VNLPGRKPKMSSTSTWTVTGMTCGHCVASVTEELQEVPGVTDVQVVLPTGTVTVSSDAELSREAVEAAVTEAGYQLA